MSGRYPRDVAEWMARMTPAERAALDEDVRRLVAEAPPVRPEVLEMLRRDGFPFSRNKHQQEAS